jgi:predicted nucleotidyltransferase
LVDFVRPVAAVIPGVQGRILAVLAEASGDLNLRTIARLSGVSLAQASRVLPVLVDLGVVERRETPPSALFRLVEGHVASQAVLALARARLTVLDEIGRLASELCPAPLSVIVFGSLARGEADRLSDIDLVVVRAAGVDEDHERWFAGLERFRERVRRLTGNRVELVGVGEEEIGRFLGGRRPLWRDVAREGIVVFGRTVAELKGRLGA